MRRFLLPAVYGLFGVLCGSLLSASIRAQTPASLTQNQASSGRFQIVFSPHMRADTFLLDTQTGRVWEPTKYSNFEGEPVIWEIQDRIDDAASFRAWALGRKRKE